MIYFAYGFRSCTFAFKIDSKLNSVIGIAIPPQFQASGNACYNLMEYVVYQQLRACSDFGF